MKKYFTHHPFCNASREQPIGFGICSCQNPIIQKLNDEFTEAGIDHLIKAKKCTNHIEVSLSGNNSVDSKALEIIRKQRPSSGLPYMTTNLCQEIPPPSSVVELIIYALNKKNDSLIPGLSVADIYAIASDFKHDYDFDDIQSTCWQLLNNGDLYLNSYFRIELAKEDKKYSADEIMKEAIRVVDANPDSITGDPIELDWNDDEVEDTCQKEQKSVVIPDWFERAWNKVIDDCYKKNQPSIPDWEDMSRFVKEHFPRIVDKNCSEEEYKQWEMFVEGYKFGFEQAMKNWKGIK